MKEERKKGGILSKEGGEDIKEGRGRNKGRKEDGGTKRKEER